MTKQRKSKQKKSTSGASPLTNIIYLIGLLAISLVTIYVIFSDRSPTDSAEGVSAETLALGETVYQTQCASCHGEDLEGEADWKFSNPDGTVKSPPHDETGHTWHHGDGYLISRIRYGTTDLDPLMQERSNMPAFSDLLTDAEIDAVLVYIKSEWPTDIQVIQAERTAAEQP